MKRKTVYRLFVFTFLALLIPASRALADGGEFLFAPAVYNVATDCTVIVTPNQSIQTAVTNASNGDVVCVRAGTYNQAVMLRPSDSGITLQAYPGERPVLNGQGTIPDGKYEGLIHVNASNVTVEGFDVFNSAGRGIVVAQLGSETQSQQNVVIRDNYVHGATDQGININGNANNHPRNILIENNVVYDNLEKNAGGADNGGSSIVFLETENSVARGNMIYHNLGEGLVADRWTSGLTFEDNVIYDNKHAGIYLSTTQSPLVRRNFVFCTDDRTYWRGANAKNPAPGIVVRDEDYEGQTVKPPASNGQVIVNNFVVGCGNNFIVSSQMDGGGLNGAVVANNSFINARGDAGSGAMNVLFEGDANFRNSRFVNNLIMQTDPSGQIARIILSLGDPDMSTFNISNNLYSYAPPNNWVNNEAGRVLSDPKLANPLMPTKNGGVPSVASYGLQSNSPAINAGTAVSQVTEDYFKQARSGALDIGADEQGGGGNSGPTTGNIIIALATLPDRATQVFSFTASYVAGGFQLSDDQTHDSGQMAPGTYSVSQTNTPGWTSSATCSDGSQSNAIALAAGETVTCTFTNQQEGSGGSDVEAKIYVTTNSTGTVGGVAYAPGDILTYDGAIGAWSTYFDGSDVGVNKALNDFVMLADGSLLIVHSGNPTLPLAGGGSFKFMMQDVARFAPTSLGPNTAGAWSVYFDGSDVELAATAEKIDALGWRADGALLISTFGTASVTGADGTIKAQDEDLLAFQPSATGANTQGVWSLGFNGTAVPGMKGEDVSGVWYEASSGAFYLTVTSDFAIGGVSGTSRSIIAISPSGAVSSFWNAAAAGFSGAVDGLHVAP